MTGHMYDRKIGSIADLPKGSVVEGTYGDRIVAIVPDVLRANAPGDLMYLIRPRFFDRQISVRIVYLVGAP